MKRDRLTFAVSIGIGLLLTAISLYFAIAWARQLRPLLPAAYLIGVIVSIALLPGYLSCSMFVSNLFHTKPLPTDTAYCEPVTVVICARNEQATIYRAISHVIWQSYRGPLIILCVDNNSTDRTQAEILRARTLQNRRRKIQLAICARHGKANALNTALRQIHTRYFITVDADTFLAPDAVEKIIGRLSKNPQAGCIAGNLFVAEPETWVQKMQIYDYLISIAAVKRFQGSYRTTLVAQGAFSAYDTNAVRLAGGWQDAVGEDIVLTYRLLAQGKASLYEPQAVGITVVPGTLHALRLQRTRWAYGMFDGLRSVKPWRQTSFFSGYFEAVNLSVVLLDLGYVFGFLAGVVLCLFGRPWFVGWITLLLFPGVIVLSGSVYRFQKRLYPDFPTSFSGAVCFLLLFQAIQSLCSLCGYAQFLLSRKTKWKEECDGA